MTPPRIDLPDSGSLAAILREHRITIAVTSKSEGALCLLSAGPDGCSCVRYRAGSPMGISFHAGKLAVGSSTGIQTFRNASPVAAHAAFVPMSTHYTGAVSVHEVAWLGDELYFANTLFSSICRIDSGCSFSQVWRPSFIDDVAPADACHLNGMAVDAAGGHVVTVLAVTGAPSGWRQVPPGSGALVHAREGILVDGLDLPHSPVRCDGQIYFLESGRSQLWGYDLATQATRRIFRGRGVLRGLALHEGIAALGISQIRAESPSSATFGRLSDAGIAGVLLVDLRTGKQLCEIAIPAVREISSLAILPFGQAAMLGAQDPQCLHTYRVRTQAGEVAFA